MQLFETIMTLSGYKTKFGGKTMKKLLVLFMLGITLVLGNKFSSQAAYEYDAPEALDGTAMVKELLILPGGTMSAYSSRTLSKLSEEEIEYYFWVACEDVQHLGKIDADLWNWFLNSTKYTTQQKYEICNNIKVSSNIVCYWLLLNEEISVENKVFYFRTHEIRYTDDNIKNWWWINIGSKLTVADVNSTDSHNFEWYRRALYNSSMNNKVEIVYIGSKDEGRCYMDTDDIAECVRKGTIRVQDYRYRTGNGPVNVVKNYYSLVGYNTGYMMWKLE